MGKTAFEKRLVVYRISVSNTHSLISSSEFQICGFNWYFEANDIFLWLLAQAQCLTLAHASYFLPRHNEAQQLCMRMDGPTHSDSESFVHFVTSLILIKCYNLLLFIGISVCVSLSVRWPLLCIHLSKLEPSDQPKMGNINVFFSSSSSTLIVVVVILVFAMVSPHIVYGPVPSDKRSLWKALFEWCPTNQTNQTEWSRMREKWSCSTSSHSSNIKRKTKAYTHAMPSIAYNAHTKGKRERDWPRD